MLRGRITRSRNRNPSNLHVIPTASANRNDKKLQQSLVTANKPDTSPSSGVTTSNSPAGKKRKRQPRRRNRKRFAKKTAEQDSSDCHDNSEEDNTVEDTVEKDEENTVEKAEKNIVEEITLDEAEESAVEEIDENTVEKAEENIVEEITLDEAEESAVEEIEENVVEEADENVVEEADENVEEADESVVEEVEENAVEEAEENAVEKAEENTAQKVAEHQKKKGRKKLQPIRNTAEKAAEKTAENAVENTVEKTVESTTGNATENIVENAAEKAKNTAENINGKKEETHNAEVVPEASQPAEDDLDDEVASPEGKGKRFPVGFRKTKLHYLIYKKKSFFKPKFYNFSNQRTFVNCLNVDDNVSVDVDVDVVSEAEYDDNETDPYDANEKFGTIVEIEDEDNDESEDVTIVKEVERKDDSIVIDKTEESAEAISVKINEEYTKTTDSFCEIVHEVGLKPVQSDKNSEKETIPSKSRMYKSCIKDSDDLVQGKSLIQDKLDAWKSHLIGLEYLLEICNKDKSSVLKYYCALCDEELEVQELSESYVINHVSGYNHAVKYLEKHFPTCDFKFNENTSYDFVLLQRLCEKINENAGYYFMCITHSDYYTENKLKIKSTIQDALHASKIDFKFEKNLFEKNVNADLLKDISNIIKDAITKILPENELAIELKTSNEKAENMKNNSKNKSITQSMKKKMSAKPTYLGNNAVAAFLRLSFSATNKLKSSAKKTVNKEDKPKANTEQITENDKTNDKEIKESMVSQQITSKDNESEKKVEKIQSKDEQAIKAVESKDTSNDTIALKKEVEEKRPDSEAQTPGNKSTNQTAAKKTMTPKPQYKGNSAVASYLRLSFTTANKFKPSAKKQPNKDAKTKSNTEQIVKNDKEVKESVKPEKIPPKNSQSEKNMEKIQSKDANEFKKGELDGKRPSNEVQTQENSTVTSTSVESSKVNSSTIKNIANKKVLKNTEKALSIHSRRCPKTFLDKGIARLAATKITAKGQLATGVSNKFNVKYKPITEKVGCDIPKKIPKKFQPMQPTFSVTVPFQQTPAMVAKSAAIGDASLYQKSTGNLSKAEASTVGNDTYHWKPLKAASPEPTSDVALFLKKIAGRQQSVSPIRKRRISKSPVRKITSPIRVISKTHSRRYSKSPVRRRSKSPVRRSRSPIRKRSRSPLRRRSRSPRRRSRSPRRRSRSPGRRYSRSPRRRSRSPSRRYSRSPLRRRSRSPVRRRSRSPVKRRSRSPYKRHSRSPIKRRSRSPYRGHSKSPLSKLLSSSTSYKSLHGVNIAQSSNSREYFSPDEHYQRTAFNNPKHLDFRESEIIRSREESKMFHPAAMNKSERYKSQAFSSARGISDLNPVSDKHQLSTDALSSKAAFSKLLQKASKSSSDSNPDFKHLIQLMKTHGAEIEEFVASKSSKSEKTSAPKVDLNLQQTLLLQQYLLANLASNIQGPNRNVSNLQFTPPQPSFMPENVPIRFGHPSVNLPGPVNMPPIPTQPAAMQSRFFPPNMNVPPPVNVPPPMNMQPLVNVPPPVNVQPLMNVQPPINVQPPHLFQHTPQPVQDFSPKPKPTPEVMFKDLKATLSKLFGANEANVKQDTKPQMPSYVTSQLSNPEKLDQSHSNATRFNAPLGQKNVYSSDAKNIGSIHENPVVKGQTPAQNKNNAPGQFPSTSSSDKSLISNMPSVPPPDAKVTFCDTPQSSPKANLFPVNQNLKSTTHGGMSNVKVTLAQRLASVLVKIGLEDVPAPLIQEMLMKIGAFSSSPRQDISENEILSILKKLGYLS